MEKSFFLEHFLNVPAMQNPMSFEETSHQFCPPVLWVVNFIFKPLKNIHIQTYLNVLSFEPYFWLIHLPPYCMFIILNFSEKRFQPFKYLTSIHCPKFGKWGSRMQYYAYNGTIGLFIWQIILASHSFDSHYILCRGCMKCTVPC